MTVIPELLRIDENALYLFSINDVFSKFGANYISNNKKSETILYYLKLFINIHGKPNSIHSENGKEFKNEIIEAYCKNNYINLIHGRLYHP